MSAVRAGVADASPCGGAGAAARCRRLCIARAGPRSRKAMRSRPRRRALGHVARRVSPPARQGSATAGSAFSMDARLRWRAPRESIDLQYYLLQNDTSGARWQSRCATRSLRGVRVRLAGRRSLHRGQTPTCWHGCRPTQRRSSPLQSLPAGGRCVDPLGFLAARLRACQPPYAQQAFHRRRRVRGRRRSQISPTNTSSAVAKPTSSTSTCSSPARRRAAGAIFDDYWNSRRVYTLQSMESAAADRPRCALASSTSPQRRSRFPRLPPTLRDRSVTRRWRPTSIGPPLALLHGTVERVRRHPE